MVGAFVFVEQEFRGSAPELLARLSNRRECHGGGRRELDVVVADDGEVAGHPATGADRLLEQAERQQVVGAERSGGPSRCRETSEALAGSAALRHAECGGGDRHEDVGVESGCGERFRRTVEAVAHLPDLERAADEGDPSMADICDVFDRESPAQVVIGCDRAEILAVGRPVDDHQRGAALGHCAETRVVRIDRGDQDAVHTLLDEEIDVGGFALVAVAEEQRHARRLDGLLDALGDVGEEGAAAEVIAELAEVAPVADTVLFGGAARMELLVRRVAELIDRPVRVGSAEAAGLGNAVVQGVALGVFATLGEGRAMI